MKKGYIYLGLGLIILFFIIYKSKTIKKAVMTKLTRGLKNRNPGNIRLTSKPWKGEITGTDKAFKTFQSMEYGYRALYALLKEYIGKGFNTVEKIISRYAPPIENLTNSYISSVEKRTGLKRTDLISSTDLTTLTKLVEAISWHENGVTPDKTQILGGAKLL